MSRFPTTQWGLVVAAGGAGQKPDREALGSLCKAYWYPVYVFARTSGCSVDEAGDLPQGFFVHLIEHGVFRVADPDRGSFRAFLRAALAAQTFPYYFTYYNPLAGGSAKAPQVMMIGWGEGLDQAARYLNDKPGADNLKVVSWYADGPFSFLFHGETNRRDLPALPQDLPPADYLVIYAHQWQRQLPSRDFWTTTPLNNRRRL